MLDFHERLSARTVFVLGIMMGLAHEPAVIRRRGELDMRVAVADHWVHAGMQYRSDSRPLAVSSLGVIADCLVPDLDLIVLEPAAPGQDHHVCTITLRVINSDLS